MYTMESSVGFTLSPWICHMFICIQMLELYFLINYELPNKAPSTRKLRDALLPPFHFLGKDAGTQRAEKEKAIQQVDRPWPMS